LDDVPPPTITGPEPVVITDCASVTFLTGGEALVFDSGADVTMLAIEWIAIQNGFFVGASATFTTGVDPSLAP
jgi:hypothetical protein